MMRKAEITLDGKQGKEDVSVWTSGESNVAFTLCWPNVKAVIRMMMSSK